MSANVLAVLDIFRLLMICETKQFSALESRKRKSYASEHTFLLRARISIVHEERPEICPRWDYTWSITFRTAFRVTPCVYCAQMEHAYCLRVKPVFVASCTGPDNDPL